MLSEYWKNTVEDIEEIQKRHVIIKVYSDIVYSENKNLIFKDYNYWCLVGFLEDNLIEDILKEYDFSGTEVNEEGEYECVIIVARHYDYDEVIEDQFILHRTIIERNREESLNLIFKDIEWGF